MINILAVDDEPDILDLLSSVLRLAGFEPHTARNGQEALEMLEKQRYDLVLLDIMMPRLGGTGLVEELARKGIAVPIIFLTAKDSPNSKVQGLNLGADDYITKPFDIEELVARIRSVLRRTAHADVTHSGGLSGLQNGVSAGAALRGTLQGSTQNGAGAQLPAQSPAQPTTQNARSAAPVLEVEDVVIDTQACDVYRAGQLISLTPTEYQILEYLAQHRGQIVYKNVLAERIGAREHNAASLLDTHISALRHKLNAYGENFIITKRSMGYLIR